MESIRKLDNLYKQMEDLTATFHFLGNNCSKEAEKLKNFGMPPDPHFIKELKNAAERFNEIRTELEHAAVDFSWKELNGQADSMAKLQEILSGLREHLSGQSTEAECAELSAAPKDETFESDSDECGSPEHENNEIDFNSDLSGAANQETFGVNGDLKARYPELLYNLIEEEKLGPAFWLACYCEQVFGTAPVPSWLIKAVELASTVQGKGGPASKRLSYLYKSHDFLAITIDKHPSRQIAFNLLAYSALLRPALLAPESGATVILEKLMDLPEALKTLAAAVKDFSGPENEGEASREIDILSREVKVWKKQNQKLTLASPKALKIWDTMQNEEGILSKLLTPIEKNVGEELESIRLLFNYLREKENLKIEIRKLYQDMTELQDNVEIFHVPGSGQIINRTESALKLVERWIKLHEKTEEMIKMEESSQFQDLSENLVSARRELDQLIWQHQENLLVKAGLSACVHAIDSIAMLLEEKKETTFFLTSDEVVSLETGNNPELLLKPNWKPQNKTVEKMGKALLELLEEIPPGKAEKEIKIEPSASVISSVSPSSSRSEEEVSCPILPDLDKLCRNEILTAQEQEFISDNLKKLR